MKRYFEYKDEKSSKFWEISISKNKVITRYGKIGSDGQETEKENDTKKEAQKMYEQLVKEKQKKGYKEIGNKSDKKSIPTKTKSTPEKNKKTSGKASLKKEINSKPLNWITRVDLEKSYNFEYESFGAIVAGVSMFANQKTTEKVLAYVKEQRTKEHLWVAALWGSNSKKEFVKDEPTIVGLLLYEASSCEKKIEIDPEYMLSKLEYVKKQTTFFDGLKKIIEADSEAKVDWKMENHLTSCGYKSMAVVMLGLPEPLEEEDEDALEKIEEKSGLCWQAPLDYQQHIYSEGVRGIQIQSHYWDGYGSAIIKFKEKDKEKVRKKLGSEPKYYLLAMYL